VLKECIQPWLDEAFVVSAKIEGNLAHMQAVYELGQAIETDIDASVACVQRVQQMAEEFVASVRKAQKLLDDLHAKIFSPAE